MLKNFLFFAFSFFSWQRKWTLSRFLEDNVCVLHTSVHMCTHPYMHAYTCQNSMLAIFLILSLPYFKRQGLSLNLKLTILARLGSQQVPNPPVCTPTAPLLQIFTSMAQHRESRPSPRAVEQAPYLLYWLVLSVNLTQVTAIKEEGTSAEEMFSWDPAIKHFSY